MKWINLARDTAQLPESCRRGNESSHFRKAGIFLKRTTLLHGVGTDQPAFYAIVADMSTIAPGPATDSPTLLYDR